MLVRHSMVLLFALMLCVVATAQAPAYPGNGSDLAVNIAVNGVASTPTDGIHNVVAGDLIDVTMSSPGNTLNGNPFALVLQIYDTPFPIPGIMLPGDTTVAAWFTTALPAYVFETFSGSQPFGPALVPGGFTMGPMEIPASLGGSLKSVMVQVYALDPGHNTVSIGASDGHELRIM